MNVELEVIRKRVREGKYLFRSHAVVHALKEGFERRHIVDAVLQGKVIEDYPEEQRVLVCGTTMLTESASIYLHVVCEYSDDVFVEFVTAYLPDELLWEKPPFKRRERSI